MQVNCTYLLEIEKNAYYYSFGRCTVPIMSCIVRIMLIVYSYYIYELYN